MWVFATQCVLSVPVWYGVSVCGELDVTAHTASLAYSVVLEELCFARASHRVSVSF